MLTFNRFSSLLDRSHDAHELALEEEGREDCFSSNCFLSSLQLSHGRGESVPVR